VAHKLEAWIAGWDAFQPHVLYTGADDAVLKVPSSCVLVCACVSSACACVVLKVRTKGSCTGYATVNSQQPTVSSSCTHNAFPMEQSTVSSSTVSSSCTHNAFPMCS
jgi:hypothetical protein